MNNRYGRFLDLISISLDKASDLPPGSYAAPPPDTLVLAAIVVDHLSTAGFLNDKELGIYAEKVLTDANLS